MKERKIAATVTGSIQVAEDAWDTHRDTKIFSTKDSIADILKRVGTIKPNPKLGNFTLSEVIE